MRRMARVTHLCTMINCRLILSKFKRSESFALLLAFRLRGGKFRQNKWKKKINWKCKTNRRQFSSLVALYIAFKFQLANRFEFVSVDLTVDVGIVYPINLLTISQTEFHKWIWGSWSTCRTNENSFFVSRKQEKLFSMRLVSLRLQINLTCVGCCQRTKRKMAAISKAINLLITMNRFWNWPNELCFELCLSAIAVARRMKTFI